MINALEEAGLPHVIKALGLEAEKLNSTSEKTKDITQKIIKNSIEELEKIKNKAGLNRNNTPSGSLVENIKEKIEFNKKAKLTWKQQVINEVWGEGGKEKYNHDQPNDVFYIDEISEMDMALQAKLQYEKDSGQLIELTAAEEVLFNAFRQQRDAWLNWPSRVAPLMAADLDVPADRMTEVLIEHVHKHISVLGEPEFNPAED